ncbi:MAG: ATP-binding protein [Clostridia bacterium]|nr:ATP-binding protein [Clostridia bacterium]
MNELPAKETIIVLRNLLKNELFAAFLNYAEKGQPYQAEFLNKLYSLGKENNLLGALQEIILKDENAFSVSCANGKLPSAYVLKAYKSELEIIFNLATNTPNRGHYSLGKCLAPFDEEFNHDYTIQCLYNYYQKNGYGEFIDHSAFVYENDNLKPVATTSKITLESLKDYESEKQIITSNLINFLNGLPFSDMLLYGDRGTGKSSTVHAMLNKYFSQGLRLIEVNKENLKDIPAIKRLILSSPLKFIIFIDDLSLDDGDEKTSLLKSNLEGSISGKASNVMIVATSNRRHIVKENYSDRENSVHARDSIEEQLSLSDRFGIIVLFSTTDKEKYLSIVKQLAADKGLPCDNKLVEIAERWALTNGGRSPRRAAQIVDMVYSCRVKGEPVDF